MKNLGVALISFATVISLAGCSPEIPNPVASAPVQSTKPATSTPTPISGALVPVGDPVTVAKDLEAPWSVIRLSNGGVLISERDSGKILELANGSTRVVGQVAGVSHDSEGGLLGLALLETGVATWLYAYFTSDADNRIVRMELDGSPGAFQLGEPQPILTGLAKAGNHNGGRIAFGPDGKLYATVGDAGEPDRAQDKSSLNGKILRLNPDGSVPSDNPFANSFVYSMGHRNPQGLAWDASGQLWAAEFGQDTWDEFNRIVPGANYGWPIVEGIAGRPEFVDPILQWHPEDASPSGLSYINGTFFLASLRGSRLWVIQTDPASATSYFVGEFGRLRDVTEGPNGTLWVLTNNTDGRGDPQQGDDRILQFKLEPHS